MRNRMGVERGLMQQPNGDGTRQGVERGGQVSSSVLINFVCACSTLVLTLYFFRLSLDSPHGQRIVARTYTAGLPISDTHTKNQFADEPEGLRHFRGLARKNQIYPEYFCLGIILKVILNNFQNNA